jgi:pimeloyl-ACP methyl ester carboxylesterase
MGANVASLYAGVMPERVVALINIEGFGLPDSDPEDAPGRYRKWVEAGRSLPEYSNYASLTELASRITRRSAGLSDDRALFVADKWAEARPDGVIRIKVDRAHKLPSAVLYRRQEALACWKNVTAPVLIVVGADTEFEIETASLTFNHSRTVAVAGAGHMVHFDQPAALAESIEEFFVDL